MRYRNMVSIFKTGCLFLALAALMCSHPALAYQAAGRVQAAPWGFFRPAWESTGINAEMAVLLTDPQNRIEPEFRIPVAMRKRVLFWALVYGRYDSRMRIVHDRRDPGLIYGVIDFAPLFANGISPLVRENRMKVIQAQILGELRRRLEAAWRNHRLAVVSDHERDEWRRLISHGAVRNEKELGTLFISIRTQTGQRDMFEAALRRSSALLPEMEKIFRRHRLPVGLSRIPFVESSFNNFARSKVRAMGVWQFMPRTARAYIHPRDRTRWTDPLVQTEAAARWLKRFRPGMPDWGTTITSYNSGTGRISRLVAAHRVKSAEGLVELAREQKKLGFAGQNFYAEVLAANLVEAYKTHVFVPKLLPAQEEPRLVLASFHTVRRPSPIMAGTWIPVYR